MRLKLILPTILLFCFIGPPALSDDNTILPEVRLDAYFIGYEENDVVFHIVNREDSQVEIKGISFQNQILYRPIEKTILEQTGTLEKEEFFTKVIFRATGDFVWSENHISNFRIAYNLIPTNERRYVKITSVPSEEE